MNNKNRPVMKWRVGAISVGVFENSGQDWNGEAVTFYSVQIQRSFKDRRGEWQNTNNLNVSDIPRAILLLLKVHEYVQFLETGRGGEPVIEVII